MMYRYSLMSFAMTFNATGLTGRQRAQHDGHRAALPHGGQLDLRLGAPRADMLFTVAIGAKRNGICDRVVSALGQRNNVVHLQVWFLVTCPLEWGWTSTLTAH